MTTRRIDPSEARSRTDARSTPLQMITAAVGVVFLLVGVLGFVPGVTTNAGDIELAGHDSEAELLGLFEVNVLHNVVHILFGVVGLAMARSARAARSYLMVGGLAYLGLWLYGLAIDLDSDWNVVSLNTADNWLHLGLGAGMVTLGYSLANRRGPRTAAS